MNRRDAALSIALALAVLTPAIALAQHEPAEGEAPAARSEPPPDDEAAEGGEAAAGHAPALDEEAALEGGDAHEAPVEDGAEPAVRGGDAANALAADGGTYEPDQRGEHDEREEVEADAGRAGPSVELSGASVGGTYTRESDLGFELSLWLGGALTALDVAGDGNLVRESQRGSFGSSFGFAAGMRFGPVIVGPRVGLTIDPSFLLADLGLGVDVLLMDGAIAPYVRAAGYGSLVTGLASPLPDQDHAGIAGAGAELGAGVRWRPWRGLVVALDAAGIWRHLFRDPLPACSANCADAPFDLTRPGESDALQLRLSLSVGWTF